MAETSERRAPWHHRAGVHALLLAGGLFFLLPLVWMVATSLKPLDQTLQAPESVAEALLGMGYRAPIGGRVHQVTRERQVIPTAKTPFYVVRPKEDFAAGELRLSFTEETWRERGLFNRQELERMNARVTPEMRVLADETNRFDPETGVLTLASGRRAPAELVRRIRPDPEGETLWLVREWRPEDTDTKEVGATTGEVDRAWDVLPERKISQAARPIPHNYPVALRRVRFGRSLLNTLFVCIMGVSGAVVASVVVAYGFAFIEFRGRAALFGVTLATIMIPFAVVMIPLYLLYREFGWIGTFKPLWVPAWFGTAFFIFLLRQFFLGLPKDLLDAARIDGCTELQILWHVVVPLSRPAIAMVALFAFLHAWKDFLGPLIYLSHPSQFTLSLSLQAFASQHGGTPWHLLMAASTVFSLPLIVLFFLVMKTFIRGVTMTGIKG